MDNPTTPPTTECPVKRRRHIWRWLAIGFAGLLLVLVAATVGLRYWITTDSGRALITTLADGRRVGPLGTMRISGLQGDPLTSATLNGLVFVDDNGIWMRANGIRLSWSGLDLLSRKLRIEDLNINDVEILRRPQVTRSAPSGGGRPDLDFEIAKLVMDTVRLNDGVYGARASYHVELDGRLQRDLAGALNLSVTPLNVEGDNIDAEATWSQTGDIHARILAEGQTGGALAALLQSPQQSSVSLSIEADGAPADFSAAATLAFGDETISEIRASRTNTAGAAEGYVRLDRWPLVDRFAERFGERIAITGDFDFTSSNRAPLTFDISSTAGRAFGAGVVDLERFAFRGPVGLRLQNFDLARQSSLLTGGVLSGDGEAQINSLTDWSFSGPVHIDALATRYGRMESLNGPVDISYANRAVTWSTDTAVATALTLSLLDSAPPSNVTIAMRGQYDLPQKLLTLDDTLLTDAYGQTTLNGRYDVGSGALAFSGRADVSSLAQVSSLSGAARGDWSVTRPDTSAPYRISLDGRGEEITTANASLAQLLGADPRVNATILISNGQVAIEAADIPTQSARLSINGDVTKSNTLSGDIDGELLTPLELSGAQLNSLRFDGLLGGTISRPTATLDLHDTTFTASGVAFTGVQGRATISGGETASLELNLDGAVDSLPLDAQMLLTSGDGRLAISNLFVSAGDLTLTAPRLALVNGSASGAFGLEGSVAGLAGFTSGSIDAEGQLSQADGAANIALKGEAADIRRGPIDLRRVEFDASTTGSNVSASALLESRENDGPNLRLTVNGRSTDGGWSGNATASGEAGAHPIAMTQPAAWTYGPQGWSFDGRLDIFGGAIDADMSNNAEGQHADIKLETIDLRSVTRLIQLNPIVGSSTGSITLDAPAGEPRSGRVNLELSGLNPLGASVDPLDIKLSGDLNDDRLTLTATGAGGQFSLDGEAALVTSGAGLLVTPVGDAPLSASLRLNGRAEQFWAIVRQRDHALAGDLAIEFTAAGTLDMPLLEGGFSIADGVYDHGESGLHLEAVKFEGEFNRDSVRIPSLTASDGRGGSLTGKGQLNWSDTLAGSVTFDASALNALGREDRSAVVTGKGEVSIEPDAILISGDMTVLNARFSVEQPASAKIPTLANVRRINFPGREETQATEAASRPIRLDLKVDAPRRVYVYGRGLDMEWGTDFDVTGTVANPIVDGRATLIRGDLNLAGKRYPFDTGSITLDGPIRSARIDISATGRADGVDARVRLTGSPTDPQFVLESTPSLPQDEILSRLLFGRSASQLSALETAQLAAALAQLAGGQAAFDPSAILRETTGLDRISIGAEGDAASIAAGKYIADDVFLQLGTGGEGGAAAEVEWEPTRDISIISTARGNGDTRMTVRWKKDY